MRVKQSERMKQFTTSIFKWLLFFSATHYLDRIDIIHCIGMLFVMIIYHVFVKMTNWCCWVMIYCMSVTIYALAPCHLSIYYICPADGAIIPINSRLVVFSRSWTLQRHFRSLSPSAGWILKCNHPSPAGTAPHVCSFVSSSSCGLQ